MKPLNASLKVYTLLIILFFASATIINAQKQAEKSEPVKIGLLIPDSLSNAARLGAEMAVRDANASGGLNGRPFRLITKFLDGPWGTGSKQAVNLIFDDKVWVLVGSHDGRNAHLVEQAATKARVVYVSAWSGDPTLSQAFVPWFFNVLPNYNQQAEALVDVLYSGTVKGNYVVLYDNDYDSRSALKSLILKARGKGQKDPVMFDCDSSGMNPAVIYDKVRSRGFNSIVLLCQPRVIVKLVEFFNQKKTDLKLFSTVTAFNENQLTKEELKVLNVNLYVPSAGSDTVSGTSFCNEYYKLYGKKPGFVAASAFDALNIIIIAIKNAGSGEREEIQKALYSLNYRGVTGMISFDGKGNIKGTFGICGPGNINRHMPCF